MCELLVPNFCERFFSDLVACLPHESEFAYGNFPSKQQAGCFYVSDILLTIALMCLSVVLLTHKAKLSGIALSSGISEQPRSERSTHDA